MKFAQFITRELNCRRQLEKLLPKKSESFSIGTRLASKFSGKKTSSSFYIIPTIAEIIKTRRFQLRWLT